MKNLYFLLIGFVLFLSGCTKVVSKTTSFYEPDYFISGNLYVTTKNEKLKDSIEFKNYKRIISSRLELVGYMLVDNIEDADHVAYLDYKMDDGRDSSIEDEVVFKKLVTLDIYDKNDKKVYESNTVSFGSCDSLYTVMPGMIDAMFTEYPGFFGDTRKDSVYVSKSCE